MAIGQQGQGQQSSVGKFVPSSGQGKRFQFPIWQFPSGQRQGVIGQDSTGQFNVSSAIYVGGLSQKTIQVVGPSADLLANPFSVEMNSYGAGGKDPNWIPIGNQISAQGFYLLTCKGLYGGEFECGALWVRLIGSGGLAQSMTVLLSAIGPSDWIPEPGTYQKGGG